MAIATVEERLATLEEQMAQLLAQKETSAQEIPWWRRRYGAFAGDEMYESAMRYGAEYRRSQPTAAEEIEAIERAGGYVPPPEGLSPDALNNIYASAMQIGAEYRRSQPTTAENTAAIEKAGGYVPIPDGQ